jgi:hypothetical protein
MIPFSVDRVDAAGFFEGLTYNVAEAVFQTALDFFDDLRICLFHVGDALDNFHLLLAGKTDKNFAGFLRRQMCQNERDGLRMLILNECQQIFAFSFLKE